MAEVNSPRYWSCFSQVGLDLADATYRDMVGGRYAYDSNVGNHKQLAVDDVLVIRDRHLIYGYGVVERIESEPGVKLMARCPQCRSADLAVRRRLAPTHRCNDCRLAFDEPIVEPTPVTQFVAFYESYWFPLTSPARVRELDDIYASRDRQNAIRRLDPERAVHFLRTYSGLEAIDLSVLAPVGSITGGHIDAIVRVRLGQRTFRSSLLDRFGASCAVTGAQPEAVLDAAHLYSFAKAPVHRPDGGLLLRTDVHRLFDRLLLTFDPKSWSTRVAPPLLERFPSMHALDHQPITVPERTRPALSLVADHYRAARESWRDPSRLSA